MLRYVPPLEGSPPKVDIERVLGWAYSFDLDDEDAVKRRLYRDFQLRYVHRWEMHHLLRLCGYEILDLFGDFDRSPFEESSSEMVWIARPTD